MSTSLTQPMRPESKPSFDPSSSSKTNLQALPQGLRMNHMSAAKSLQSCSTLCNPVDCSLPGPSVNGILQARILEWVAMPSSSMTHTLCLCWSLDLGNTFHLSSG